MVDKDDNLANVPECRPIEDFWSILKQIVYADNWQVENVSQLRSRIEYCLNKVYPNLIYRLSKSIKGRLNMVLLNGVLENQ